MSGTTRHASVELETPRTGLLAFLRDFHNKTILFRAGDWIFVTYGMIAGLAFLVGVSTATWYMGMVGADTARTAGFYLFFAIPSILMVSRLTSILLEWRELFRKPLQTLLKPGYMLHGGIFGGMMAFAGYSWSTGISLLALLDAAGFCMPLGEAICRLGCYVYGCCWGRPTDSRFGVAYTSPHSKVVRFRPELQGVKIHPTQLYALTAHLIQFTIFYALLPFKVFDGMFAALYLITHPIIRFALERFRQDDRGQVGRWTHTNIYSLMMIAFGVLVLAFGLASDASNLPINLQLRYIHVIGNSASIFYFVFIFLAACAAFGVHYKSVGSWLSKPSGGMKVDISEMGMGATDRDR
ncbi:prolipoprotein diacylglyceryl transferase [Nannocystis pusilla]|uniref:Prolipoprotein diacylglyceryl transferase n=1 Tax=Nannocystis pusilla TaxID=889268 RepID=A0ABS7U2I2_9BACT|nr:prolipoprotein diacylglyceryl transferase family protein [Nannocystis pusilla]MBZ5714557.1 prolipoprotein diacylglyceryl transferase [Nannocystis pusilla]